MAGFKFVISDPQTKKSFQKEVDQSQAVGLMGKKIGDEISGDILGLAGYSVQLTGGSDNDGFPMHPKLKGPGRKRMLLTTPPGFHPEMKGLRKRKMVHGDTISDDIVQINCKVVKKGDKPLEELVPMKPKEKPAKKEEAKQEKPVEKEVKTEQAQEPKTEKKEEKPKEEVKAEPKPEAGGEKVQ